MRTGTDPLMVGVVGAAGIAGAFKPLLKRWPGSIVGALPSASRPRARRWLRARTRLLLCLRA